MPNVFTALDAYLLAQTQPQLRLDADGIVACCNPAAAQILGRCSGEDVVGQPGRQLHDAVATALDGTSPRADPPGSDAPFQVVATALSDGAVVVALTPRSVSPAPQARAVTQLVATVAHELRNPTFAIDSLLQVLRGEPAIDASDELAELCDKARQEVRRMTLLIADLAALGRPAALQPCRVDVVAELRAALEEARQRVGPLRGGFRVQTELSVSPELATDPGCTVDPVALRLAIVGLVRNAWAAVAERAAVREQDCRVDVTAALIGESVRVQVRHRGVVVAPDVRARVFEPFAARQQRGAGLVLAVAAERLAAMGGTLTLGNSTECGTEFIASFPVHES